MARAQDNGRGLKWAIFFAALAPASAALGIFLQERTSFVGDHPVVDGINGALYVLMLCSMVAAGVAGGLIGGTLATATVWLVLTAILYAVLDPSCPLVMSQAPPGVAASTPGTPVVCHMGGEPTRGENVGFVILGGMFATLLAMVGGAGRAAWAQGQELP